MTDTPSPSRAGERLVEKFHSRGCSHGNKPIREQRSVCGDCVDEELHILAEALRTAEQERDVAEAQCADAERFANRLSLDLTARDQTIADLREALTLARNYISEIHDRAADIERRNTVGAIRAQAASVLPDINAALTPPAEGPRTKG